MDSKDIYMRGLDQSDVGSPGEGLAKANFQTYHSGN